MELIDIYTNTSNPLDNRDIISKLLRIYCESSDIYTGITRDCSPRVYRKYNIKDRNLLFVKCFHTWRNGVIELASEKKNKLREDFLELANYLRKHGSSITTYEEMNKFMYLNEDDKLNNLFEKYSWQIGLTTSWDHFYSRSISAYKEKKLIIKHRLYLNIPSDIVHKFANIFIDECKKRKIGYYFKIDDYLLRSDSFVIYSSDERLKEYIDILNDIKNKYPDLFNEIKEPPFLSANIDGWIGYGSEPNKLPNGDNQSFNGKRSEHIEKTIKECFIEWIRNNKDKQVEYNGESIIVKNYIASLLTDKVIEYIKNKLRYYKTSYEGVSKEEVSTSSFKNSVYNTILKHIDKLIDGLINKKPYEAIIIDREHPIKVYSYEVERVINRKAGFVKAAQPDFVDYVQKRLKETCESYDIDSNNYGFDLHVSEHLKKNNQQKFKPVEKDEVVVTNDELCEEERKIRDLDAELREEYKTASHERRKVIVDELKELKINYDFVKKQMSKRIEVKDMRFDTTSMSEEDIDNAIDTLIRLYRSIKKQFDLETNIIDRKNLHATLTNYKNEYDRLKEIKKQFKTDNKKK